MNSLRISIYFTCFIFCGLAASGQSAFIDSVLVHYKSQPRGERSINLNLAAREAQFTQSTEVALELIATSLKWAEADKDSLAISKTWSTKGIVETLSNNFRESLKSFRKSLPYRPQKDSTGIGYTYRNIGVQYFGLGHNDSAIQAHFNSLYWLPADDSLMQALTTLELSKVFYVLRNYEKCITYARKSLNHFQETQHIFDWSSSHNSLGLAYLGLDRLDSAEFYFTKALELAQRFQLDSLFIMSQVLNLGLVEFNRGNYKLAEKQLKVSYDFFKKTTDEAKFTHAIVNLGGCYIHSEEYDKAEALLLEGYELSTKLEYFNVTEKACYNLWKLYEKKKEYEKALHWCSLNNRYMELNLKVESNSIVTSLERELEYRYRGYEMELLQKKNSLQQESILQQSKLRSLYLTGLIILILLIIPLMVLIHRINIQNKSLGLQKEQIEVQRLRLDAMNRTKDRYFSIIGHDLRGPIANIHSLLQFLPSQGDKIAPESEEILNISKNGLREVHNLLENLLIWAKGQGKELQINVHPQPLQPIIEKCSELLQPLCKERQMNLDIQIPVDCGGKVDGEALYTVIRNLTSNALKYSPEGTTVTIQAINDDNELVLQIIDEGPGISQDAFNTLNSDREFTGKGLGLKLSKGLTEQMGGVFRVENGEPGTRITLIFPN